MKDLPEQFRMMDFVSGQRAVNAEPVSDKPFRDHKDKNKMLSGLKICFLST